MNKTVFTVLLVERNKAVMNGKQLRLETEGGSKVVGNIL